MRFWLIAVLALVNLNAWACAQSPAPSTAGFLLEPAPGRANANGHQTIPYRPRPGDIILYDQHSPLYHAAFKFAGTTPPTHTAIVVAREDGTPALLDITGAMLLTSKVGILDVMPRLANYPGDVFIRRLRVPLTPEQSRALTSFAQAQSGKRFAVGRILLFATPFSPRRSAAPMFTSDNDFNRRSWYCSEIVFAAGVVAQIIDPSIQHRRGVFPRDLADDDTINLSSRYLPPAPWVANRVSSTTSDAGSRQ